ncbi:MAG: ABC transporter permease [Polyangiaceae bacterium]
MALAARSRKRRRAETHSAARIRWRPRARFVEGWPESEGLRVLRSGLLSVRNDRALTNYRLAQSLVSRFQCRLGMTLARLAIANARRSPLRAALTILAVAVSLVAFVLLRSVIASYTEKVSQTPNNRVVTRHKVGWDRELPVHYAADIARLPGIKHAMGGRWAGLRHPVDVHAYIDATAVQAKPFIEMHYELVAPAEQKQAFVQERRGLFVSEELAKLFGWRVGDTVPLEGTWFPGHWTFKVSGIYRSSRHGFAQRSVWLHWEYYNELIPKEQRDHIHIVSAQIFEPREGARIAKSVDIHFDDQDEQTFTQEDQVMAAAFLGNFGAILQALEVLSVLILGIVLLIVGNTMAMSVRERTREFGVLRAIGFSPRSLLGFVLAEAALLGLCGSALGTALSYPLIERPISRYFQDSMHFDPLWVPTPAALFALALGALLGALAAVIPAHQASRVEVTSALRQVG